jgi:2-haloacid dehalogenase
VFPISFFFRSTPTSTAQELKRQIKVLMFGPYGTVVDMPKGLTEIAAPFLKAKGC